MANSNNIRASDVLTGAIDSTSPYMHVRCTTIVTSLFSSRDKWGGWGILRQSSITGGATEESTIGLLFSMAVMDIRKDKDTTEVVLTITS